MLTDSIPSCPVTDLQVASAFMVLGRWPQRFFPLSWSVVKYLQPGLPASALPKSDQKQAVRDALAAWAEVADLAFEERLDGDTTARLLVSFEPKSHGDWDFEERVLAHAYFPDDTEVPGTAIAGDTHIYNKWQWAIGVPPSFPGMVGPFDLKWVLVHEFGHALGIGHSDVEMSIMYPAIHKQRALHDDDKTAIISLYGERVVMTEQWCPFARGYISPTIKRGYGTNLEEGKSGVVFHSAEGNWEGLKSVLNDPGRTASWHFSILKDGTIYQHYSVWSNCWHSGDVGREDNLVIEGNLAGNLDLVGIEFEGRAVDGGVTTAQIYSGARLYNWLATECGFQPPSRDGVWPQKTLWEHREVGLTTCPSGRMPWNEILREIRGEAPGDDDMPDPRFTDEMVEDLKWFLRENVKDGREYPSWDSMWKRLANVEKSVAATGLDALRNVVGQIERRIREAGIKLKGE